MDKKRGILTKAMISLYLKRQGLKCPYCGCTQITGEPLEADGPLAWSNAKCYRCNREWVDRYELTGISEVEDDRPECCNDCCQACGCENDTEDEYCSECTRKHELGKEAIKQQAKRLKKLEKEVAQAHKATERSRQVFKKGKK
jgi:hypothetical protein